MKLSFNKKAFQIEYNSFYPEITEVQSLNELLEVCRFDNTCGTYKNNHRCNDDFLATDVIGMDVDNGDTDNPDEWQNEDTFAEKFFNIHYFIVYSRHHMLDKKDKDTGLVVSARPRFHVYFPLSTEITNHEAVSTLKRKLKAFYMPFDKGALDAARFYYGIENPNGTEHNGNFCIDQIQTLPAPWNGDYEVETKNNDGKILKGERNSALFQFALETLFDNDKEQTAEKIIADFCDRLEPPLPQREINTTVQSAKKYVRKWKKKQADKLAKEVTCSVIEDILAKYNIKLRFNSVTKNVEVTGLPLKSEFLPHGFGNSSPEKCKRDSLDALPVFLSAYLKKNGYKFNQDYLRQCLNVIAVANEFNPVLEAVKSISWDGTDRIYDLRCILHIQCLNHESSMLRKWLIQSIAILHNEGNSNAEIVLVLQGKQNAGKTEFFRVLAVQQDWFLSGAVIDMMNKDSIIQATSTWLCEIGELDSTLKKEQASLKAFITQTVDRYRKPYAVTFQDTPRRTSFCATVNPERFLRDETGSRRFVTIHVNDIDVDKLHSLSRDWLLQLWRQIYELYLNGEQYRLTQEEIQINEQNNIQASVYLAGECEILEGLNWNVKIENWTYKTASQIGAILHLKIGSERIGRALTKIARLDNRIKTCTKKGYTVYLLPNSL